MYKKKNLIWTKENQKLTNQPKKKKKYEKNNEVKTNAFRV